MNEQFSRDRLIGLLACAKVIHRDDLAMEETARRAIVLYDLLLSNATNPTVLPREQPSRYRVLMDEGQWERIEKLLLDNQVDRAQFEQWLAKYCPSVKDHGIAGLSSEEADRILGRPEGCLQAFRAQVRENAKAQKGPGDRADKARAA